MAMQFIQASGLLSSRGLQRICTGKPGGYQGKQDGYCYELW
jgi:hypothetical protein